MKRKIRKAKSEWLIRQCKELEELDRKHDSHNVHQKIRELTSTGNHKSKKSITIWDDQNRQVTDENEIKQIWEAYINQLFSDNRGEKTASLCTEGPGILKEEVECAIRHARNRKAVGPDNIPVEIVKLIDDENIGIITKLFNNIYESGNLPQGWLLSTFVALPKKPFPKHCKDYLFISLMSQVLKLFLRIIYHRIRNKCESDFDDPQFGFRKSLGTREALFGINVFLQKCRDQRKDIFACFIDYEKAFDRIQHRKLIEILKSINIDDKDVRIIQNL